MLQTFITMTKHQQSGSSPKLTSIARVGSFHLRQVPKLQTIILGSCLVNAKSEAPRGVTQSLHRTNHPSDNQGLGSPDLALGSRSYKQISLVQGHTRTRVTITHINTMQTKALSTVLFYMQIRWKRQKGKKIYQEIGSKGPDAARRAAMSQPRWVHLHSWGG